MTTSKFQIEWPLNMPLSNRDICDGEQALVRSEVFQTLGLQLLCGVRFGDLSRDGELPQSRRAHNEFLDYLICRDDTVLAAVHLTNRDVCYGMFPRIEGLAVAVITEESFAQGNITAVLGTLAAALQRGFSPVWTCRLQPCGTELLAALANDVLVERQSNGNVVPTEYGMFRGLVRVRTATGQSTRCSPRTAQRLQARLRYSRPPQRAPARRALPFEDVLRLYHSGLHRNGQVSAQLVQDMMEMPLQEYMNGFPDEWEQLQSILSQPDATYAEAACKIYTLLHASDNDRYLQGVDLMQALAVPPILDRKVIHAVQTGSWSQSRAESFIPERYTKTANPGRIHSFQDCIQEMCFQMPAGMRLASDTLSSFFQGVSILAQSDYPYWLNFTLRRRFHLAGRDLYPKLISLADHKLQEEGDSWSRGMGIRLLYLLLIEPFCLIVRKNKKFLKERTAYEL